MILITMLFLFFAACTDIRKHEVPLWVTPLAIFTQTAYFVYCLTVGTIHMQEVVIHVICGLLLFIILYLCMIFGNLGGADVLLAFVMGYSLGLYGLVAVLYSFILALPYLVYMRVTKNEHEYPFVPFMMAGYALAVVTMYVIGTPLVWLI